MSTLDVQEETSYITYHNQGPVIMLKRSSLQLKKNKMNNNNNKTSILGEESKKQMKKSLPKLCVDDDDDSEDEVDTLYRLYVRERERRHKLKAALKEAEEKFDEVEKTSSSSSSSGEEVRKKKGEGKMKESKMIEEKLKQKLESIEEQLAILTCHASFNEKETKKKEISKPCSIKDVMVRKLVLEAKLQENCLKYMKEKHKTDIERYKKQEIETVVKEIQHAEPIVNKENAVNLNKEQHTENLEHEKHAKIVTKKQFAENEKEIENVHKEESELSISCDSIRINMLLDEKLQELESRIKLMEDTICVRQCELNSLENKERQLKNKTCRLNESLRCIEDGVECVIDKIKEAVQIPTGTRKIAEADINGNNSSSRKATVKRQKCCS